MRCLSDIIYIERLVKLSGIELAYLCVRKNLKSYLIHTDSNVEMFK